MVNFYRNFQSKISVLIHKAIVWVAVVNLSLMHLLIFAPKVVRAAIDTCTWDGSSSANWSDGANWSGCDNGGVPEDGDALIFPVGASNTTNTNDIVGLDLDMITYSGSNYSVTGNAISLTGGAPSVIIFSGNLNAHDIDTTITASSSKAISYSGSDNLISGNLILAFSDGDMNFSAGAAVELEVSGVISGTTGLLVVSPDTQLYLSNTNTFNKTGVVINNGAELDCGADECYGSYTAGDTITIWGNGALYLNAAITMQDGITTMSGTNSPAYIAAAVSTTLSGAINIQDDTTIAVQNMIDLDITELINFNTSSTLTFEGTGDLTNQSILVHGDIFESGGTGNIVADNVFLELNDASTYEGTTTITNGAVVSVQNANALGSDIGETIVEDGATLYTDAFIDIAEPITISGAGAGSGNYQGAIVSNTTTPVFSGEITLDGDSTILNLDSGMTLSLRGTITGVGDLTLAGLNIDNAPIEIGGSGGATDAVASSYVGHTYVNNARLFMHKNTGVNAVPGDVTVTAGTYAASLWTMSEEQIPDDATVTLDDAGVSTAVLVVTGGRTETVGTVIGDGVIQLGSSSDSLIVGGGNKSGTFSGTLWATNASVTKIGTGTWNFSGDVNMPSGIPTFEITAGTMLANPSNTSMQDSVFDLTGGTLGGDGIVGPITASSGSVSPGNSPGCLNPDGDVVLLSTSSLDVQLAGTAVCTDYDKLDATGTVVLGGSTLNVSLSFTSTTGNSFTIVEGTSVTGTFAGLANNATINSNGRILRINYTATTVTLTDVGAVPVSNLGTTGVNAKTSLIAIIFIVSTVGAFIKRQHLKTIFYSLTR